MKQVSLYECLCEHHEYASADDINDSNTESKLLQGLLKLRPSAARAMLARGQGCQIDQTFDFDPFLRLRLSRCGTPQYASELASAIEQAEVMPDAGAAICVCVREEA